MLEENYPKWLRRFTQIFSIIGTVIITATPFKKEIYEWACVTRFVFFPVNIITPPAIIGMIVITILSFYIFKAQNLVGEITILFISIIGIPSVAFANYGIVIMLLCGPYTDVFLPSYYISIAIFAVLIGLSIYLLVRKVSILKTIPKPSSKLILEG